MANFIKMGLIGLAGLAMACSGTLVQAATAKAKARPDFSGVWTWFTEPGSQAFRNSSNAPVLPFKPDAKAKADAYRKLVAKNLDTPGTFCLGTGMPGSMTGSGAYPMEITQTPAKVLIVYEAHSEIRRIFINDTFPDSDKVPDRNGYSKGRWEGDVLVVETDNLVEQVDQSHPHSANAKIVERYRLGDNGKGRKMLINDWEMTDPDFYTASVKGTKKWLIVPNGRLLTYECNEPAWDEHLAKLRAEQAEQK
jgi:hypothetical protein